MINAFSVEEEESTGGNKILLSTDGRAKSTLIGDRPHSGTQFCFLLYLGGTFTPS